MSITRHKSDRWFFQFNRVIPGVGRQRVNRLLSPGWTRAQVQAYEQRETAGLYKLATGGQQQRCLIEEAVLAYLQEHAPFLKNRDNLIASLQILHPYCAGKPIDQLPQGTTEYTRQAGVSPSTVRNRLAYLRAACRWAWKHKGMG